MAEGGPVTQPHEVTPIRAAVKRPSGATRDGLLQAARRAFAERGFAGASTREIAALAGAPQGLVRHHFGSKEGLFRAVVAGGFDELGEALDALAQREPLTVASWVRCLPAHADLVRLVVHALLAAGPQRDFVVEQGGPLWERLRALHLRAQGALASDARLAMWVAASIVLPVWAAGGATPDGPDAIAHAAIPQRNTLYAWLIDRAATAPSGPFSLGAARSRLRG